MGVVCLCIVYMCAGSIQGSKHEKNDVYGLPGVTVMVIDSFAS